MQGMDLLFFYTSETGWEGIPPRLLFLDDERNVASVVLKPQVHFDK